MAWAGWSLAPANATAETKALAREVSALTHNQDFIADALFRWRHLFPASPQPPPSQGTVATLHTHSVLGYDSFIFCAEFWIDFKLPYLKVLQKRRVLNALRHATWSKQRLPVQGEGKLARPRG